MDVMEDEDEDVANERARVDQIEQGSSANATVGAHVVLASI